MKEFTWPIDINKEGYENFNNLKERLMEEIPEGSFEGDIKIRVWDQNPNINIFMQYHILTSPPKSKKAKICKLNE